MAKGVGDLVRVDLGYAATPAGLGIAYAKLSGANERVLRLAFRTAHHGGAADRAAGYAALAAVARALHKRGIVRARFVLPEQQLVDELTTRCRLPQELALPYVRLRCALNALERFELENGVNDELVQRARAEAALNLAA